MSTSTGTFTLFDSATLWLGDGTELLKPSNPVNVILVKSAENLTAASELTYADLLNELPTGGGYTQGGVALTGFSVNEVANVSTWSFSGPTPKWTAWGSGIPAWRWAVFYVNATLNGHVKPLLGLILGNPANVDVPATTAGNTLDISGAALFSISSVIPAQGGDWVPVGTLAQRNSDFMYRVSQKGTIRFFHFNDATQIQSSNNLLANYGVIDGPPGSGNFPVLDTSRAASGNSSIKYTVPDNWGPDAGDWYCNFSSDYTVLFGAGQQFFVQLRTMWDSFLYNTAYLDANGNCVGGGKYFDLGAGDQKPGPFPYVGDGITHYASSTGAFGTPGATFQANNIKLIHIAKLAHKFPLCYHPIPNGSGGLVQAEPLIAVTGGILNYENSYTGGVGICSYNTTAQQDQVGNFTGVNPGCWLFQPNQWITFQTEILLGTKTTAIYFGQYPFEIWANSEWRVRVAYEGQPSTLIIDWTPTNFGTAYEPLITGYRPGVDAVDPGMKYGKLWLFNFQTGRDATRTYGGTGHFWYDEVIIASEQVPDPAPLTAPMAHPTLQALQGNTCIDLGLIPWGAPGSGAALTFPNGESLTEVHNGVPAFSGCMYDPKRTRITFFGGGHAASSYNSVIHYDVKTLQWSQDYPPTPAQPDMIYSNYDTASADGTFALVAGKGAFLTDISGVGGPYPRPAARHTTDALQVIDDEMILLGIIEGNGQNTQQAILDGNPAEVHNFNCMAQVAHYDLNNKVWTFENKTPTQTDGNGDPSAIEWPATSYDPYLKKIIIVDVRNIYTYDTTTQTKTSIVTLLGNPSKVTDESGNPVTNTMGIIGTLEYCHWDQKHYYFPEQNTDVYRLDLDRQTPANSKMTKLTTSGTPPSDARNGGINLTEHAVRYDIQNNIFGVGPYQNKFYAFDPTTKTWLVQTMQGFQASSVMGSTHWMEYVPIAGCFMFYAAENSTHPAAFHWCAYKWA